MSPLPGQSRLAALVRRARLALLLDGAADGFAIAAALAGLGLLLLRWSPLRLSGGSAWIAPAAVLLVALACGLLRQARRAPDERACAAWLDRHGALGGLLLARLEVDAPAWDDELRRRLGAAPGRLPSATLRRPVARLLLPGLFLAGMLALPAPRDAQAERGAALGVLLDDLSARLDTLEQAGSVEHADADDLRERLAAMDERLLSGDPLAWSELDRVAQELELSAEEQAAEVAAARDEADALAAALAAAAAAPGAATDGSGSGDEAAATPAATSPEAAAALAALLAKLKAQGLLSELPAGLAARLDADGDGRPDVPISAADAARLAQELADALAGRYGDLVALGLADPAAAERLAQLAEGEWEAARKAGHEHTEACRGGQCPGGAGAGEGALAAGSGPGRGSVSRGRGDASLRFLGETEQDAARFTPERLPSAGPGLSPDWALAGVSRVEPIDDPQVSTAPGHGGDAGSGESLRRRRVAPRHEEAVQRFFGGKP